MKDPFRQEVKICVAASHVLIIFALIYVLKIRSVSDQARIDSIKNRSQMQQIEQFLVFLRRGEIDFPDRGTELCKKQRIKVIVRFNVSPHAQQPTF